MINLAILLVLQYKTRNMVVIILNLNGMILKTGQKMESLTRLTLEDMMSKEKDKVLV